MSYDVFWSLKTFNLNKKKFKCSFWNTVNLSPMLGHNRPLKICDRQRSEKAKIRKIWFSSYWLFQTPILLTMLIPFLISTNLFKVISEIVIFPHFYDLPLPARPEPISFTFHTHMHRNSFWTYIFLSLFLCILGQF